jgi:hypothetical protein
LVQQIWDDHTEPSGTLPAIGPAPLSFLNDNGGEKWAGGATDVVQKAIADLPIIAETRRSRDASRPLASAVARLERKGIN